MFQIKIDWKSKFCYVGHNFYIDMYPLFLHNTRTHFVEKRTCVIAKFFCPSTKQCAEERRHLVLFLESVEEQSWGGSRIFPKDFCHALCVLLKEKQSSLLGVDSKSLCCAAALLSVCPHLCRLPVRTNTFFSSCLQFRQRKEHTQLQV